MQSNALAALEAIDPDMAAEVMQQGCITGDRINGLCDGVSGEWYCKFDTYHPAVDNGLPVTRVISRVLLQQILAKYAIKIGGEEVIQAESKVVKFSEDRVEGHDRVRSILFSFCNATNGVCLKLFAAVPAGCHLLRMPTAKSANCSV